ncbi:MAG: ribosome-associated translation inhibitor RaiA [Candidatus Pacebacteria bacterium]|nr:ribosome-associated translation inhibitor RaiA [Candidatus Paceibacterota bacterium]
MNINITAKNLELTDSLRVFINKKLESISKLVREWEEKGAVEVDFEVARTTKHHHKGDVFYAEANLKLGRKELIRAERSSNDVRDAIDMVKKILKEGVNKYKKRKKDKK